MSVAEIWTMSRSIPHQVLITWTVMATHRFWRPTAICRPAFSNEWII